MTVTETILQVLVRLPFWAVFALPLVGAAWYVAVKLRATEAIYCVKAFAFVPLVAFLLAPMPMGMFLVLLPNGYLLFSGTEYYVKLWPWLAVSYLSTLLLIFWVFHWHAKSA